MKQYKVFFFIYDITFNNDDGQGEHLEYGVQRR